ncbi:MAG: arginyltransferase [Magnetococcales bacterium]|nr:arginyltransferase [Magnetococcales bacterium]
MPHPCGYLPGRVTSCLLADPDHPMDESLYEVLLAKGFRRSGSQIYRPRCAGCGACFPVRLPVERFCWERSWRRVWKRNLDLHHSVQPPAYQEGHYRLYKAYLQSRHGDGPMAEGISPESYLEFLAHPFEGAEFHEFWLEGRVVMVAVVDRLPSSLSAVYTFFDPSPALARRSLGSLAVLWQIVEAQRLGLPWVYLGYWIEGCRKMSYKSRFAPLETLTAAGWRPLMTASSSPPEEEAWFSEGE